MANFRYNDGLCISNISYNVFKQLGYQEIARIPEHKYKKLDGTPVDLPSKDNPALIVVQDMVEVKKSGLLDTVAELWSRDE